VALAALDEAILTTAIELCHELRVPRRYDPQKIVWSEKVPWDSVFFSPGVRRRNTLMLPLSLRTTLEPDLWRPILAFSLIQIRSRPSYTLVPFFMFVIPLVVSLFAFAYASLAFGRVPTLALGLVPIFILSLFFSLRYTKRSFLRHINEATDVGGREAMLAALRRIDSLGIWEIEREKKRHGMVKRLWPVPDITERMEYLRTKTD
jgi:hypothetical protein